MNRLPNWYLDNKLPPWFGALLWRFMLTGLYILLVLPIAGTCIWLSVQAHTLLGYVAAIGLGFLCIGIFFALLRLWRGYWHRLLEVIFPEFPDYWSSRSDQPNDSGRES